MMMKEVQLVVKMRSASCRTDLQGLQLLLSAVPASAALTFLSAHSQGWIFLQEILNFPSSYKNLFFQMTLEHNIFFKISFIFRQNPPKICPFLICKSQYTPVKHCSTIVSLTTESDLELFHLYSEKPGQYKTSRVTPLLLYKVDIVLYIKNTPLACHDKMIRVSVGLYKQ